MNVKISQLPQAQIPLTANLTLFNEQFERTLCKIHLCTGKTSAEIISFVTGSVVSYPDLAEFAAAFGRLPDLQEQWDLHNEGMAAFEGKLILMAKANIESLKTYGSTL